MKRRQSIWSGFLLIFCATFTVGEIIKSTNSTDQTANGILYPSSSVDLIVNFFKTYKHIKRLTLFLCDDDSSTRLSVSIPIRYDYDPTPLPTMTTTTTTTTDAKLERQMQNDKPKLKQKHERHGNCCLNFQQIVKYLMASGNFLIKGDGNIDATMFTTSGHDCNIDMEYEKLDSVYAYRLSEMLERGDFKQGVVLDLRCRQSRFILQQPQQSNSGTNSTPEWNIYDLYDVWNPGKLYGGILNVSHMGTYSADEQFLNISFKETTIIRRLNVHGIKVRAMVVVTNPFNESFEQYLDHTYNPHLDSMNRFNYRLLSYVREMFNFRWVVYRTNSWGYLKNGTFDGMIGSLVRKEIDVGGSPIFFRSERAKVIDYTARTWISRPCFVFRHPTGLVGNVFLQPFNIHVWYCVIVVGVFIIGTTSFISKREGRNSDVSSGSHSLTNRLEARMKNVQSLSNRSKKWKRNQNDDDVDGDDDEDDAIAMQSQQQTCRRHQISDSMLNTVQLKQHGASMTKREKHPPRLCFNQQKQTQIIPEENVIIGICTKVFRFFSTRWLPVSVDQRTLKKVQTMNKSSSHKKINHENFRSNVYEFYSGGRNDSNAFATIAGDGAGAAATVDRGHSIAMRNEVGNVNSKPTKAFDNVNRKYDESAALSRCALLFIGALCQQGSSEMPQFTSRRCIIMLILLFGFFMFQFYSASIVGSLLMEKPKTIKTLRNLIDSPLKLGIEDIVYNKDFFKRTTDAVALELYDKKVKVVNPKTGEILYNFLPPAAGMDKVKHGGFAFHADTATFYKIIIDEFSERSICELSEIQLFPEQHMMAIVQKGSPLRKMITYGLRRTFEHGLLYYERKRWHSPKPQCVRQMHPEDLMVSIDTIESAFFILILGILLSVTLLLIENAIWFFKKSKQLHTITYLK
ncbi:uncharacterized protein LOC129579470 [Sitodiplosis mosellana]|uniref:uncharacterized protein LOC129579470 n=1 Tax=Sitodiplosis mosellana TaxID=263140 RepID=UPI0024448A65|nr:uncharacterized protein LOC129579470 [Sitodiplosis mosellana]